MTNNPLVSVVVPVYNTERYIEASLRSILSQTYENIEVIVIDDKSTDNTASIVKKLAEKDTRITFIENDSNLGIGGNRNKGIEYSRGKYICWQDADDISMPGRIEAQVSFLESHPSVGVVGGFITFFSEEGDGLTRKYAEDDAILRGHIFKYNPVAQPASMVRRKCFDEVGGYNPELRLSEDLDILFRIGEKYEFGNVQEVVLKYRQTPGSLTASNLKQMEQATLKLRDLYRSKSAYHYSSVDALYNLAQRLSLFMPTKLRMSLFKIIRGDS